MFERQRDDKKRIEYLNWRPLCSKQESDLELNTEGKL